MAVIGAHMLLYTSEPEKVRAIFRDVFRWPNVDAGEGWLIFAMPPAELGVHPAEGPSYASGVRHQVTLMCDDIRETIGQLMGTAVVVEGEPKDEGWGITSMMRLPGDLRIMLYQPRHPVAISRDAKG
jgi:hypothetical protein